MRWAPAARTNKAATVIGAGFENPENASPASITSVSRSVTVAASTVADGARRSKISTPKVTASTATVIHSSVLTPRWPSP